MVLRDGAPVKKSVRAAMRSKILRLLVKYDQRPDQEKAVELVLQQSELFAGVSTE